MCSDVGSVLCVGFSVSRVRDLVYVMCSLQPQASSICSEHASLCLVVGLSGPGPVRPPWYKTKYTAHNDVYIVYKVVAYFVITPITTLAMTILDYTP